MLPTSELQIFYWAAGVLLVALILVLIVHVVYRGLPAGKAKTGLDNIIYQIDRHADNMENAQKRAVGIQAVMDVLGWRRIIVPKVLVALIIDFEVAWIRRVQKATDTPNLHKEDENNG